MKSLKVFLLGMLCFNLSHAQNELDALRYSNLNYFGTARFIGVGGAMGAIGADMSAITLNPAGMGKYSRSDFNFTTDLSFTNISANYNGKNNSDGAVEFNLNNIGVVFAVKPNPNTVTNWKRYQFGFSRTKINDFVGNTIIKGNSKNSMLHSFVNNANGVKLEDLASGYEGLAYDAYLLNKNTLNDTYYPLTSSTDIDQEKNIETYGNQFANDIIFSGNYNNKFLIGGSIGFPSSKFNQISTYKETFNNDTVNDLENFSFKEDLNTNGSGINAKFGVIIIPTNNLRIGLSVHSATAYNMTDKYQNTITSDFTDNSFDTLIKTKPGVYNYEIVTPARYLASVSYLYKNRAFFSFDYEYTNHSKASLDSKDYNFDAENQKVKDIYKGSSILKIGAEFRVTNYWTVRAGAAYYGSSIKSTATTVANSRKNFSGGFGYKNRKFSVDFTYLKSMSSSSHYLYDPALTNPVTLDKSMNNFMISAGMRF